VISATWREGKTFRCCSSADLTNNYELKCHSETSSYINAESKKRITSRLLTVVNVPHTAKPSIIREYVRSIYSTGCFSLGGRRISSHFRTTEVLRCILRILRLIVSCILISLLLLQRSKILLTLGCMEVDWLARCAYCPGFYCLLLYREL
jgi:hypothetical protein